LDLLTYSIYIFVSLTRLFLNLYTAHSDVGGTEGKVGKEGKEGRLRE
jgi:hypothetical protein